MALLNLVTLIAIMFAMGMQAQLSAVVASAKRFRIVAWALLANFGAVPLVTLMLLRVFHADAMVSAGFLILALCPGAPACPPLTALAKGDLPTAIGLMVILSGLSAILAPALLGGLLALLEHDRAMQINRVAIVTNLILAQLLPLGLGLGVRQLAPKVTERVARPVALLANLLLVVLVVMILVNQGQTLAAIQWRGWFGMLLLLAASLAIGWLCGGPDDATRRAIIITTGVRNAVVGLAIAGSSFAGTPAVTAVVAYGLASLLGALGLSMWFRIGPLSPAVT